MCCFGSPLPFLCTFLNLKGNRATRALAVGNALSVTEIRQTIKSGLQGSLYFCRRAHYRQRCGSKRTAREVLSVFIPKTQVPSPGSSQAEEHRVTIFPERRLSFYWSLRVMRDTCKLLSGRFILNIFSSPLVLCTCPG